MRNIDSPYFRPWNPVSCAAGCLGIPVQARGLDSWSQFPPTPEIFRHTPSPLLLLPHLIPGNGFFEVWEETEVDSGQQQLTQYFRMDRPRVWRVLGPSLSMAQPTERGAERNLWVCFEGSQREFPAGICLETRGRSEPQIKMVFLNSQDVNSVVRVLYQTAPFFPSTTLSHQVPKSLCTSQLQYLASSRALPVKYSFHINPPANMATTHFSPS